MHTSEWLSGALDADRQPEVCSKHFLFFKEAVESLKATLISSNLCIFELVTRSSKEEQEKSRADPLSALCCLSASDFCLV